MQVNRSVSNQQHWLFECQLVYLLFRLSPILFGSAIFSWLSQTILGHLLLEEAIFLLPLVLTWLGYKSKQAWCHYLASAVNAHLYLAKFQFSKLIGLFATYRFIKSHPKTLCISSSYGLLCLSAILGRTPIE